jgi:alkylation response protein AidB-like acyl-CoA dehydrogenase
LEENVDFSLSQEHEALRNAARTFLAKEVDLSKLLVPGATVEQAGYDPIWSGMVELGWPGIVIPEEFGGLGMSYIDLAMIVGEVGRHLASAPLLGTLAGAWAIEHAGSPGQKRTLLSSVAQGKLKLALAIGQSDGSLDGPGSDVKAKREGAGWKLTGTSSFVVDAAASDKIVVAAEVEGGRKFFVVDRSDPKVHVEVLDWRDITRQVCKVSYDNVSGELLVESRDDTWPWVRDRLHFVLATESAAGITKVLEDSVEYAKQRVAFGRPIGAFQAIKHQLAEVAGLDACATAAVHYAAWALSTKPEQASISAAMAQSYASDAYREATFRHVQVFGAIGFTWQMSNHLYYKRARSNAELLGAPRKQREQIVRLLEANPSVLAA